MIERASTVSWHALSRRRLIMLGAGALAGLSPRPAEAAADIPPADLSLSERRRGRSPLLFGILRLDRDEIERPWIAGGRSLVRHPPERRRRPHPRAVADAPCCDA